jgi:hypothetical protein
LVLCYLEGKTQDEAMHQLGWSRNTFRRRLEDGRSKLRLRLTRRGITLSAGLWATLFSDQGASAAISSALAHSTVQAAIPVAAGELASAGVSPHVTFLVREAHKTAAIHKVKWIAVFGIATSLATGIGLAAHHALTAKESTIQALERNPSAEVRRRIEALMERIGPERIRPLRAIEVLEHIGTSEAEDLLKKLATGAPEARLTQEAQASLNRLANGSSGSP